MLRDIARRPSDGGQSSIGVQEQIEHPIKRGVARKRTEAVGPTFITAEPKYYANFYVLCVL